MTVSGRRIEIEGTVQGVGFRPWVYRLARAFGLRGGVHNGPSGVTIEAFGAERALDAFMARLEAEPPARAHIARLSSVAITSERAEPFSIARSAQAGDRVLSIPADLTTCAECQAEVDDPADRRFGYPFTNCIGCGPRYTISTGVPYDRPDTTMARFAMCDDCRAEYDDPEDRRFHAQPIACAVCGPRVWLALSSGRDLASFDPIGDAASAILRGEIVAVKGLGGFHLACDARSSDAVRRLRTRKRRDDKPFAVMVADVDAARELALVDEAEAKLLTSAARPIVLLRARTIGALADKVAPLTDRVGLLLPYTPLHTLLLRAVAGPIVLTSGNVADEPIAFDNDNALARLGSMADLFLLHDRPIAGRCDDSVAKVVAGAPLLLRRSRGYVPAPVRLVRPVARPVLACGAHLKNTFCLVDGDRAYLGPHVGDLETVEAADFLAEAVDRYQRLLGVVPEVVAHDLHPEYASTHFAQARAGAARVAVQHHHAHVASVMAEHGLEDDVFGVAYDGAGYGADGASWGGEVLLASYRRYTRLATFRPIALAGGDRAIREVWRIALAAVLDAFDDDDAPVAQLPLLRNVSERQRRLVTKMIERGVHTPAAHGVGRWFDAVGALVLERPLCGFEGQIAMALESLASTDAALPYSFSIDRAAQPWSIDLRPTIREIVSDLLAGRDQRLIATRFHVTLVCATATVIDAAAERHGRLPVVLSGGCMQNEPLVSGLVRALGSRFQVLRNAQVPPGDGGIALGQAVVADAVVTAGGA